MEKECRQCKYYDWAYQECSLLECKLEEKPKSVQLVSLEEVGDALREILPKYNITSKDIEYIINSLKF